MKNNLKFLEDTNIAHRGLHNKEKGIPENSLLAFKKALEKNISIELDLHLLKDNQIVVFHDDNLKRMTGYDKPLKECIYDEIKNLKLLNTNETIPLFKEVLELVNSKVLIDIEFKCDNKAGTLETKACDLLDNYQGKFIVKSFNPFSVLWFKNNRPDFIRGQLSCDFRKESISKFKKFFLKNMFANFITKPDFIAYDIYSVSKNQVKRWKSKNIPLLLWTIRTDEELELAKKYGNSFIYENINID